MVLVNFALYPLNHARSDFCGVNLIALLCEVDGIGARTGVEFEDVRTGSKVLRKMPVYPGPYARQIWMIFSKAVVLLRSTGEGFGDNSQVLIIVGLPVLHGLINLFFARLQ
jgi:hypothetical protein